MIKQVSLKNIKELSKLKMKVYKNNKILDESLMKAIKEAEEDIKYDRVYDGEQVLKELRKKYGYK